MATSQWRGETSKPLNYEKNQDCNAEGQSWKEASNEYVIAYRIKPHLMTGAPPTEALFGRKIRSNLPQLLLSNYDDGDMRETDILRKQISSESINARRCAMESDLKSGNIVLLRQPNLNKFSIPFMTTEHAVI